MPTVCEPTAIRRMCIIRWTKTKTTMKQYRVDVDFRVTKCIYVDAETPEEAEEKVREKCKNNPYQYTCNADTAEAMDVTDVTECEDDGDAEPMTFEKLCENLQYFSVDNSQQMTISEIADECRQYIRKAGFECTDENCDFHDAAEEWVEENHPEWDVSGFGWSAVLYQSLEFLCKSEYSDDLHFDEINISFYGDYDKGIGVFNVE